MAKSYEIDKLDDREFNLVDDEEKDSEKKVKKKNNYSILLLLFSFIISMGVWLYVTSLENDSYEKTVTLVPVSIVGSDELEKRNNMSVISGYDNTISVTLVGKRSEVNKYSAANLFAYVDVSGINSAERQTLPVIIDPLPDISVSVITPSEISVYADVIGEKEVEVVVRPYYTIDGNYFINKDEITKSVDTVTVSGPLSVLNTIKYAVAETNIGKVTSTVKSNTTITFENEKGTKIQNPYLTCDTSSVEISIPVKLKKNISLFVDYNSNDFAGYEVSVKLSDYTLAVSGEVLAVNAIERLGVFTLKKSHFNFEGTSDGTFEFIQTIDISLPDGIDNAGDFTQVVVEATIKKIPEPETEPPVTKPPVEPSDNNPPINSNEPAESGDGR